MNEREKLPQHEPLRVPQGWQDQARALVIQIERVFTDVYRWLGNLMKRVGTLDEGKIDKVSVKNNLTTTDEGYVLDARQGKALDDKFANYVPTANIKNNQTTSDSGYVLDARQGKAIRDRIDTLTMRSITWDYSANAGQRVNTNLKTLIDADLPTGYKCLGTVGGDAGYADCFMMTKYLSSQYSLSITNTGSSAASNKTATVYYLCIKTS